MTETVTAIGTILGIVTVMLARDWRDGKSIFRKKNVPQEVMADNRNALQPLMSKMDELSTHYNHETTEALAQIRATQLQQCTKLDLMVDSLQDIQRNGIRIRN